MSNESHFLAGRRGVGIIVLGLGFGGTTAAAVASDAASVLGGWLRRSITRVSASPPLLSSEPLLSVKDSTRALSGTFEFSARRGAIFFRPLVVDLLGSMSRGCFIFGCRAGDSQHFTLFRPAFNDFCDNPLSMSSNL